MATATTTATAIHSLEPADLPAASGVAERAFQDDPLMRYALPDAAARRRAVEWVLGRNILYGLRYGVVHVAGEPGKIGGLAVWLPPGATRMTIGGLARCGFFAAPWRLRWRAMVRLQKYTNVKERLHDQVMARRPHWYLLLLAVDPDQQSNGYGGALLRAMLDRASNEHLPCYLETANPDNIGYFEKHGFSLAAESDVPDGGPHVVGMRTISLSAAHPAR
jgi:ribosomal protein S18 acetylase RimI-like enzyme